MLRETKRNSGDLLYCDIEVFALLCRTRPAISLRSDFMHTPVHTRVCCVHTIIMKNSCQRNGRALWGLGKGLGLKLAGKTDF